MCTYSSAYLVHTSIGEEQSRIVHGHHRGGREGSVTVLATEVVDKRLPYLTPCFHNGGGGVTRKGIAEQIKGGENVMLWGYGLFSSGDATFVLWKNPPMQTKCKTIIGEEISVPLPSFLNCR